MTYSRKFERAGDGCRWVESASDGGVEHGGEDFGMHRSVLKFLETLVPGDVYAIVVGVSSTTVYYRRAA